MTAAKPKGLYAKLAEAIAEVEHVAKDGTNEFHKYRYTSAEEVYRELRDPLLKRGLVFVPSVIESQNGGDSILARYRMRIIDAESGEALEAEWLGEGQDKGDKAPYKAATGACKTFLRHLFMLPADDDPEADASTDRKPAPKASARKPKAEAGRQRGATAQQRGYLNKMAGELGLTKADLAGAIEHATGGRTTHGDRITSEEASKLIAALEGMLEKGAEE